MRPHSIKIPTLHTEDQIVIRWFYCECVLLVVLHEKVLHNAHRQKVLYISVFVMIVRIMLGFQLQQTFEI